MPWQSLLSNCIASSRGKSRGAIAPGCANVTSFRPSFRPSNRRAGSSSLRPPEPRTSILHVPRPPADGLMLYSPGAASDDAPNVSYTNEADQFCS